MKFKKDVKEIKYKDRSNNNAKLGDYERFKNSSMLKY